MEERLSRIRSAARSTTGGPSFVGSILGATPTAHTLAVGLKLQTARGDKVEYAFYMLGLRGFVFGSGALGRVKKLEATVKRLEKEVRALERGKES